MRLPDPIGQSFQRPSSDGNALSCAQGSRLINRQAKAGDSDFIALLRRCDRAGDHTSAVAALRAMKPSALDAEIRSLEPLVSARQAEACERDRGMLIGALFQGHQGHAVCACSDASRSPGMPQWKCRLG